MLLRHDAGDRSPRLHRLAGGPAVRQPAGIQELREELPGHHWQRSPARGRNPGGARGVGAAGGVEHGEAGDPGRRAPRHQLQRGGREPPPEELPVGDDAARRRRRGEDGGGGVVRGGRAAGEHEGGNVRFRRHHRALQFAVAGSDHRKS